MKYLRRWKNTLINDIIKNNSNMPALISVLLPVSDLYTVGSTLYNRPADMPQFLRGFRE